MIIIRPIAPLQRREGGAVLPLTHHRTGGKGGGGQRLQPHNPARAHLVSRPEPIWHVNEDGAGGGGRCPGTRGPPGRSGSALRPARPRPAGGGLPAVGCLAGGASAPSLKSTWTPAVGRRRPPFGCCVTGLGQEPLLCGSLAPIHDTMPPSSQWVE
eukprot:scaffold3135_cov352-Prasinococcus_capsulatus_cf.AAC.1